MANGTGSIAFVASNHPDAQDAMRELTARYEHVDPDDADIIVTLGGDGQMLRTLHRFIDRPKPIYGMHKGSVGFLMNEFRAEGLIDRLREAHRSVVHPLVMRADDGREVHVARAINEVHMLRQTYQAAKLTISVDGRVSLEDLIADGILVATPVGSTAYNLSVDGPVLPLGASLLALTPISAFRPRRWRGALLPDRTKIEIEVLEAGTRPVSAVADHTEVRDVRHVSVAMDFSVDLVMLHDPAHSLEERIRREQFGR